MTIQLHGGNQGFHHQQYVKFQTPHLFSSHTEYSGCQWLLELHPETEDSGRYRKQHERDHSCEENLYKCLHLAFFY